MPHEEFRFRLYVAGKRPLSNLPKAEREKMDAEWDALEAEAERRAPWFSEADVLIEGWNKSIRST